MSHYSVIEKEKKFVTLKYMYKLCTSAIIILSSLIQHIYMGNILSIIFYLTNFKKVFSVRVCKKA